MFSGAEIPKPIITCLFDFIWITAEISSKQLVIKSLYPTEMLWVELKKFFQSERNKNGLEQEKSKTKYFLELKCQGPLYLVSLRHHG